jgi:hypothetical protein
MASSGISFGSAWQRFFDPRTYIPFLIGSIALGVVSNGVYSLLTHWLGDTPPRIALIVVGTLAIFLFTVFVVARRLPGGVRRVARDSRSPQKRRGLIFMVSQMDPCRKAVAYHRPMLERCWLLCSTQTMTMAAALRDEFERSGLDVGDPIVINDVNDPLEFRREIDKIYGTLPADWQASEVIADYLGMTAHASVGMVLACLEADRPLEYTLPVYDDQRKPVGALDPLEIVLDWEVAGKERYSAPAAVKAPEQRAAGASDANSSRELHRGDEARG